MNIKSIYWLAGILEGEGCFSLHSHIKRSKIKYNSGYRVSVTPIIRMSSTDLDIVKRVSDVLGATCQITMQRRKPNKNYYTTTIFGNKAVAWMMTLYSLMGNRRKERIKSIIMQWKSEFKELRDKVGNLTGE